MQYTYNPVMLDCIDPKVIKGQPIKAGAKVTITNRRVDPFRKFVWVKDEQGNQQSVYKASLQ